MITSIIKWDEITYPFLNFNGAKVELAELICTFNPHFWACHYLYMLGFNLTNLSKMVHSVIFQQISVRVLSIFAEIDSTSDYFSFGFGYSRAISLHSAKTQNFKLHVNQVAPNFDEAQ